MKNYILKITWVFTTLFCMACNSSSTNSESANETNKQEIKPTPVKTSFIEGKWKITKYVFSDYSAMDDKIATQWIGKIVTISKDVIFPFSAIPSYKETFPNDTLCKDFEILKEVSEPSQLTISQLNCTPEKLGIKDEKIRILKTNSPETPIEEIFLKSENELIITWDGVFFFLAKE